MNVFSTLREGRARLSREKVEATILSLSILVFSFFLFSFIGSHSHFVGYDLDHIEQANSLSLIEMLLTPIDVHYVPLHQLISYVLFSYFPLDYTAAIAFIWMSWLCSLAMMFAALSRAVDRRIALYAIFIITVIPCWLSSFAWWSAAIHRIPYQFSFALCVFVYLGFRRDEKTINAIFTLIATLSAYGFYAKAVLFPVYLALLGCWCRARMSLTFL